MKRKILINEDIESDVISDLLTESFSPSAEKVLLVKDYIDKNFAKVEIDDIDADGYPKKDKMVNMISNGQPLKTMSLGELLLMLDDKFHTMITDDEDRKKFLQQVIKDWYMDKISKNGVLSVNVIT